MHLVSKLLLDSSYKTLFRVMKYEKWPPARMWFSNIPDDKLWINLAWMVKLTNKAKGFEITTVSQDFPSSSIFSIPTYYLPVTRDKGTCHYHPNQFTLPPVSTMSHLEWNNLPRSILEITDHETFSNNLQQHLIN